MTTEQLTDALGPTAPAADLTASKAAMIIKRDKSQVTGFVLTDERGNIGIVDKGAARWLSKEEMWWLMHESQSPLLDYDQFRKLMREAASALVDCSISMGFSNPETDLGKSLWKCRARANKVLDRIEPALKCSS